MTTQTADDEFQDPPAPADPQNPVVFSCSTCSQIVADSYSWVCSHRQLNSFTIAVATKGVIVSDELETSREGLDLGSTFASISCSKCSTILGRIYKTTPRDMYTFNADVITSYELGSEEPSTLALNNINIFTASTDDILSRMGKLEWLCVSLFERVGELEKAAQPKPKPTGGQRGRPKGRRISNLSPSSG